MTARTCADCGAPTAPNRVRCRACISLAFDPTPWRRREGCRIHGREPVAGCWSCEQLVIDLEGGIR